MSDGEERSMTSAGDIKARPSRARYDQVKKTLDLKWRRRALQAERMTREIVDGLWDAFGDSPWTWCGFWLLQPDGKACQPGPGRPDPAAGPAPVEGALAEAIASGLAKPGATTIFAPAFDKNGRVWAVFEARASAPFDDMDARWIERLFKAFQTIEKPLIAPPER